MTSPAPSPAPAKRSKRMVLWLVAVPIVILLLALAGANWKVFHLAYAKHHMSSDDPDKQYRGLRMVVETHLRKGMSLEEVRAILVPAELIPIDHETGSRPRTRRFYLDMEVDPSNFIVNLIFDRDDRLLRIDSLDDSLPLK